MFGFLKLAVRNVWRNRRRSIITVLAIGMGLALVIFLRGFFAGMAERMVEGLIKTSGHFQIHAKGYTEKSRLMPLDISIKYPEQITNIIKEIPDVNCIVPRIKFGGMVSSSINSFGVMGMGILPTEEEKVNIHLQKICEGNKLDDKEGYAVIGKKLAKDLDLKVGSMITVISNTMYGAMNATELEVKGIIDSGHPQYDTSVVFMNIKDAQRLLDMENRVTDLVIGIKETEKTDIILSRLKEKLGKFEIEIQSWKEMGESMWRTQKLWNFFSGVIDLAVILVVIMGVINTMLMSISERTREIGTMMAMGTTQGEVLTLFLLEGLILGILGGLVGSFLGGLLVQYFAIFGISIKGSSATALQAAIGESVYARFSWIEIIVSFIVAQFVAILSAFYPAYVASQQEPVEALRHI